MRLGLRSMCVVSVSSRGETLKLDDVTARGNEFVGNMRMAETLWYPHFDRTLPSLLPTLPEKNDHISVYTNWN
jgi:hypothetical protein